LYDDQEDVLSLVLTHTQALVWIINIAKNHDLVNPEMIIDVIAEMKKDSKTVWEEQLWKKVGDCFFDKIPSASIYKFSPETRGPDT
jgi:hypothetical protein|tara:strand:- start:106 stop:363 length:258 start_codon:yes stop_codon:yes gene_type:complete